MLSAVPQHGVPAVQQVKAWQLWQLPRAAYVYVTTLAVLALLAAICSAAFTPLRLGDLALFGVLVAGGAISVEAMRRSGEPGGAVTNDLLSAWWLSCAVLLPPLYSFGLAPVLFALTQWRVRRSLLHRRVLSAAAVGLSHAGASLVYSAWPETLSGTAGLVTSPLAWTLGVVGCGALAITANAMLVGVAVKLADAQTSWHDVLWDRESGLLDLVETCSGALVALLATLDVALVLLALPPVLLLQRGLMHGQLRAAARTDGKTGLLNAVTWEREAATELVRLRRTKVPSAVLLIDVDHFKRVNDKHGHLVGDRVLKAVVAALREELRDGDLMGRFGGEEFALLLPRTDEWEARRVAERLRRCVADLVIPVDPGTTLRVTVSVGVAIVEPSGTAAMTVTELLAAADAGLYRAKAAGRDQVSVTGAVSA